MELFKSLTSLFPSFNIKLIRGVGIQIEEEIISIN